ncbi:MAG: lysophospholipid acyltransferase family protein [Spirochaetes bacterium]|nr:lysophospholipid acyltransferase family protein [Spirochaetota bacterium]
MTPMQWFITYGCKLGMRIAYRIDDTELKKVPVLGPLILYSNHTGQIEAPILFSHLAPRPKVTGLSKMETFSKFFIGWVFKLWNIIPVRRGESDIEAMRTCIERLKEGYILGVAPEGTRNHTGQLIRGHGGIAVLALHSGAPLQPVAHWGAVGLMKSWKRFRRPRVTLRVGRIFVLDAHGEKVTREIRQEMADEMMYRLAMLMPEELRGEYADLSKATEKWLRYLPETVEVTAGTKP